MPLSHRIIRNQANGSNGLKDMHNLDLRHDFPFSFDGCESKEDNSGRVIVTVPTEIVEDAKRKSKDIIKNAQHEASVILEQALAKASAETERIKTEATREGYQQGYSAALGKAAAEARNIRGQARKVLEQTEKVRTDQINQLKDEILNLSLEIAEKFIQRQLELQPNTVLDISREAIQLVSNRQLVVLWVHPDELEICSNNQDSLMTALPPKAKLQIMTDDSIKKGGCIIETDFGRVDATVTARWENLLAVLKGETVD